MHFDFLIIHFKHCDVNIPTVTLNLYMLVKISWISVYGCVSDLNQISYEVSRHRDFNESGNCEHIEMMRCIISDISKEIEKKLKKNRNDVVLSSLTKVANLASFTACNFVIQTKFFITAPI